MANLIKCPKCGEEIEISSALSQSVREELEKDLAQKHAQDTDAKVRLEVQKALSSTEEQLSLIKEDLKFKNEKLDEARKESLRLHEEKLRLEDEKKSFELDKKRQLDEEREKIRLQTLTEFSETHRLKDLEKDKQMNDLKKALEDAQLKASLTSQQLQGEVLELDLEEFLRSSFPYDEITPVEKGARGADIKQIVRTNLGNTCGVILWESKRAKAWTDDWSTKLKDDLRAAKANVPIIVTTVLPKEIKTGFGLHDGVWVVRTDLIKPLAELMRLRLIEAAREKYVSQNRANKSEALYNYVVGHEFQQQIESIIEVYQEMQLQLQKERAAFEKIWKAREAQSSRLLTGTAGIIGSMQGIVGQTLPQIKGLELPELE